MEEGMVVKRMGNRGGRGEGKRGEVRKEERF